MSKCRYFFLERGGYKITTLYGSLVIEKALQLFSKIEKDSKLCKHNFNIYMN